MSLQADVQTLSVKLGVKRVFWACIVLLELAYAGAIGLGVLSQVTMMHLPASCFTSPAPKLVANDAPWSHPHTEPVRRTVGLVHDTYAVCMHIFDDSISAKAAVFVCVQVAIPLSTPRLMQVWWSKLVTVGVHLTLGAVLLRHAQQVDLQDTNSITSCYMLVWKLFYSEYLLIPFFR